MGVLAKLGHEAAPLVRWLKATPNLIVDVARDIGDPPGRRVILASSSHGLDDAEAKLLAAHVRAGGSLVLLGPTLSAWSRDPLISDLVGWVPGEPSPEAELVLRPASDAGAFSHRLDAEIRIRDRLPLGDPPPPDATALLTVPWHFAERVAAFSRPVGAGTVVYLGIGWTPGVYEDPAYHQLVYRCLRAAAGMPPAPVVGVGLYGYGAIGREHAEAVIATEGLELRGVCDRAPARRTAAAGAHLVPTHADGPHLLADPSVDLVVVGVPPAMHATAVMECLTAGKHVVCEKPFALRAEEVEQMLDAAAWRDRTLTVYQSRRWDPDFVALRRAIRSGAIGHPFYMESFIGGFGHPCGYWHSHEPLSGGMIYDWGSHHFDWLLQLLEGPVTAVSARAHKRVWHDVTNADQVRVDIAFAGGEQASFLQSDIAAANKPKWYVLGTAGAAVGDWRFESTRTRSWTGDLVEERLQPSESPARLTLSRPAGHGGVHVEVLSLPPRVRDGFYRNLADHMLLGEPLAVPPEEAGRNVALMEAAARSIAAGGRQLEVHI